MGYDITFHPVAIDDLKRFVFDVINDTSLAAERAKELGQDENATEMVAGNYEQFAVWIGELEADEGYFGSTFGLVSAASAGFKYPYYYSRGGCLSFLAENHPELEKFFQPLVKYADGKAADLKYTEMDLTIQENYWASGLIEDVAGLEAELDRLDKIPSPDFSDRKTELRAATEHFTKELGSEEEALKTIKEHYPELLDDSRDNDPPPSVLFDIFDDDGLDSLRRAIRYAKKHGLCLMEASDVVVPMSGTNFSRWDNLRAHWDDSIKKDDG